MVYQLRSRRPILDKVWPISSWSQSDLISLWVFLYPRFEEASQTVFRSLGIAESFGHDRITRQSLNEEVFWNRFNKIRLLTIS